MNNRDLLELYYWGNEDSHCGGSKLDGEPLRIPHLLNRLIELDEHATETFLLEYWSGNTARAVALCAALLQRVFVVLPYNYPPSMHAISKEYAALTKELAYIAKDVYGISDCMMPPHQPR